LKRQEAALVGRRSKYRYYTERGDYDISVLRGLLRNRRVVAVGLTTQDNLGRYLRAHPFTLGVFSNQPLGYLIWSGSDRDGHFVSVIQHYSTWLLMDSLNQEPVHIPETEFQTFNKDNVYCIVQESVLASLRHQADIM
jgi:hypothetical protein